MYLVVYIIRNLSRCRLTWKSKKYPLLCPSPWISCDMSYHYSIILHSQQMSVQQIKEGILVKDNRVQRPLNSSHG